jgi:REP element-mobilizing transposase RayT
MSRARQLSFLPKTELSHGGDTREGKRKIRRPFDPKKAVHVTLRSTRARGAWSMLRRENKGRVLALVHRSSECHRIQVHRFENVGNHLHLLVSAGSRRDFQGFLRVLAGQIAFLVTGARKGNPIPGGRFWDKLAYSRVVQRGRDFKNVIRYLSKNAWESLGVPRSAFNSVKRATRLHKRP